MHHDIFPKLTSLPKLKNTNIEHNTINFVDDSTNIISSHNSNEIQQYINNFYLLLEAAYNINKLVINKDKTELMIVCKNCYKN